MYYLEPWGNRPLIAPDGSSVPGVSAASLISCSWANSFFSSACKHRSFPSFDRGGYPKGSKFIHIHVHIYIYTYVYRCEFMYVYVRWVQQSHNIYTCTYTYVYMKIYIYMHVYLNFGFCGVFRYGVLVQVFGFRASGEGFSFHWA